MKKLFLMILVLCLSVSAITYADDYVFTDRKGNEKTVPDGEYSFASRVVEFVQGDPWTSEEAAMNPDDTLGIPDREGNRDDNALTLGAGGVLVLEFNINITDGEGDDIYVFEVGGMMEATLVEVSDDLETWYEIGVAEGDTAGLDMNGKIPEGKSFRYVRLTDRDGSSGTWPGADIDAVGGLNVKPITSDWAENTVDKAFEYNLVPEILEHAVLDEPITRLEFAAVCVRVYENLASAKALPATVNPFEDCNDVEMLKAYNVGITNGMSKTEFWPNHNLNREQAATMLTRVFKRATMPGWTLEADSDYVLSYEMPEPFKDDAEIGDWAKDSVYFMNANGIILGMDGGKFAPKNITPEEEAIGYANATREQALAIAVRMVENLK